METDVCLAHILLVEDDASLREIIAKSLERHHYKVRAAENGLVAKTIFDLNPNTFNLIISDIRMPEMDGIEFLSHVRATDKVPFIMMTGFSEILESKSAYELGANAFLPKPFQMKHLLDTIQACLSPQSSALHEEEADSDTQYCQVHIDEFMSSSRLVTDIYIRLGEKRFIKAAHKGTEVSIERLKHYRDNKVDYLYVTVEDFKHYVDLNIKLAFAAVNASKIHKEKKILILKHATEAITQMTFRDQVDKPLFQSANMMVMETLRLATDSEDLLYLLDNFQAHAPDLYSHTVSVSLISSLIAQKFGWTSTQTLFKVAMCGLFHDIGKREIDPAILKKKRILRSPEESRLIESHPSRGRDILLMMNSIPEEVAQAAHQHHEHMNGTGYPQHLRGEAILSLARLVHVADRFANLVMPMNHEVKPLPLKEAIYFLVKNCGEEIDPGFLAALQRAFESDVLTKAG